MDSATRYLRWNRIAWSVSLFVGIVAGAVAADVLLGVLVTAGLLVPVALVFASDRPWWSPDVQRLPLDRDRTRVETVKLTVSVSVATLAGFAVAYGVSLVR